MKKVMSIAIATVALLSVTLLIGCIFLKQSTNIDRTTSDYKNRKIDFWDNKVPNKISGKIKYKDLKIARFLRVFAVSYFFKAKYPGRPFISIPYKAEKII